MASSFLTSHFYISIFSAFLPVFSFSETFLSFFLFFFFSFSFYVRLSHIHLKSFPYEVSCIVLYDEFKRIQLYCIPPHSGMFKMIVMYPLWCKVPSEIFFQFCLVRVFMILCCSFCSRVGVNMQTLLVSWFACVTTKAACIDMIISLVS